VSGQTPSGTGAPFGASPSFLDLIRETRASALPTGEGVGSLTTAHGTTVLAMKFADGVVMAGDRRATAGYSIEDDRMEKVFDADEFSTVAISGVAGQAVEIVKLFQVELEHYEKVTGDLLSLEGKANRLAQMIRENFPLALQGLVVVPVFAGFDQARGEGRLFKYDPTGGRWEEDEYYATGSGGRAARGTLKKGWSDSMSREDAIRLAVQSLLDASEEDVATGGPSLARGIYPTVKIVTSSGVEDVSDDELRSVIESVVNR
jgi:proteasome beta subunit